VLEDEHARVPRQPLDVGLGKAAQLAQAASVRVVAPDVHHPVAIREEVDGAAHPDGVDVDGALVGEAGLSQVVEIEDRERGVLAAPVVAPLDVPPGDPIHDDPLSVRRVRSVVAPRSGQEVRRPAGHGNGPQPLERHRRRFAGRGVQDPRAVGGKAPRVRGGRIPGQPPRGSPRGGHHVDHRHPGAVRSERQRLPVGREVGVALHGGGARQTTRLAARKIGDPEVPPVGEGHLPAVQVGLAQQPRRFCARLRSPALRGEANERHQTPADHGTRGTWQRHQVTSRASGTTARCCGRLDSRPGPRHFHSRVRPPPRREAVTSRRRVASALKIAVVRAVLRSSPDRRRTRTSCRPGARVSVC
jgi:hypothetical protein